MHHKPKTDDRLKHDLHRKPVPLRTGTFGMYLFLAAIATLFIASIIGYLIINYQIRQPYELITRNGVTPQTETITPNIPSVHMPLLLWISTIVIIFSSITMRSALKHVQYQRIPQFNRMISLTLFLAIAFILIQTPAVVELLDQHKKALAATADQKLTSRQLALFGLIVFLITIHALHVLGGIIPLANITKNAAHNKYDHECYGPVKYISMYWHFLDAVWIIMFLTLLLTS